MSDMSILQKLISLFSVVTYVVTTYTGTKFGAGTDANVFCNLFGEQGDTGDRKLALSTTHKNKFERGNVSTSLILLSTVVSL